MDSATLFAQLQTALSAVLTDEAQLQAALSAVQNVLPPAVVDPNDAVVAGVVNVLVGAGLVTAVTPPAAPAAPEAPAPEAPATAPTDGTASTDTSQNGQVADNTPSGQPDQPAPTA